MILPWVNAIVHGQNDVALILRGSEINNFDLVKCFEASNGLQTVDGFSCIFEPMPHVCVFNTKEVGTFHVFVVAIGTCYRRSRNDVPVWLTASSIWKMFWKAKPLLQSSVLRRTGRVSWWGEMYPQPNANRYWGKIHQGVPFDLYLTYIVVFKAQGSIFLQLKRWDL